MMSHFASSGACPHCSRISAAMTAAVALVEFAMGLPVMVLSMSAASPHTGIHDQTGKSSCWPDSLGDLVARGTRSAPAEPRTSSERQVP